MDHAAIIVDYRASLHAVIAPIVADLETLAATMEVDTAETGRQLSTLWLAMVPAAGSA